MGTRELEALLGDFQWEQPPLPRDGLMQGPLVPPGGLPTPPEEPYRPTDGWLPPQLQPLADVATQVRDHLQGIRQTNIDQLMDAQWVAGEYATDWLAERFIEFANATAPALVENILEYPEVYAEQMERFANYLEEDHTAQHVMNLLDLGSRGVADMLRPQGPGPDGRASGVTGQLIMDVAEDAGWHPLWALGAEAAGGFTPADLIPGGSMALLLGPAIRRVLGRGVDPAMAMGRYAHMDPQFLDSAALAARAITEPDLPAVKHGTRLHPDIPLEPGKSGFSQLYGPGVYTTRGQRANHARAADELLNLWDEANRLPPDQASRAYRSAMAEFDELSDLLGSQGIPAYEQQLLDAVTPEARAAAIRRLDEALEAQAYLDYMSANIDVMRTLDDPAEVSGLFHDPFQWSDHAGNLRTSNTMPIDDLDDLIALGYSGRGPMQMSPLMEGEVGDVRELYLLPRNTFRVHDAVAPQVGTARRVEVPHGLADDAADAIRARLAPIVGDAEADTVARAFSDQLAFRRSALAPTDPMEAEDIWNALLSTFAEWRLLDDGSGTPANLDTQRRLWNAARRDHPDLPEWKDAPTPLMQILGTDVGEPDYANIIIRDLGFDSIAHQGGGFKPAGAIGANEVIIALTEAGVIDTPERAQQALRTMAREGMVESSDLWGLIDAASVARHADNPPDDLAVLADDFLQNLTRIAARSGAVDGSEAHWLAKNLERVGSEDLARTWRSISDTLDDLELRLLDDEYGFVFDPASRRLADQLDQPAFPYPEWDRVLSMDDFTDSPSTVLAEYAQRHAGALSQPGHRWAGHIELDDDGLGRLVLRVAVDADEGALPPVSRGNDADAWARLEEITYELGRGLDPEDAF